MLYIEVRSPLTACQGSADVIPTSTSSMSRSRRCHTDLYLQHVEVLRASCLCPTGAMPARQCGLGIPNLPAAMRRILASCTASSATQCRSNPVSYRSLPKTGIFQISAGDYRRFRSQVVQIGSIETDSQFAKSRNWRALIGF